MMVLSWFHDKRFVSELVGRSPRGSGGGGNGSLLGNPDDGGDLEFLPMDGTKPRRLERSFI